VAKSQLTAILITIIILIFAIQGCAGRPPVAISPKTPQALTLTPTDTLSNTPTKTPAPILTISSTPTISITREPTAGGEKDWENLRITPTFSTTATPVPPGVLPLLFYPPLIMNYDTYLWKDESRYTDPVYMANYIRAQSIETCTLGVQGPSGFYPTPEEIVHLGDVKYQIVTEENLLPGSVIAYYFEANSLSGYNYEIGLPVLVIQANQSEWNECKTLAENVLSTLHAPSTFGTNTVPLFT